MTERIETPVKATATSTRVVETLLETGGATVTELDDRLDLSKSSIHSHLKTLEALGFIVRDGWRYEVSLRFLQIGGVTRRQHPLYDVGVSVVRRLADSSGLTASLVVFERSEAICLYTTNGEKADAETFIAGDDLPLHCTAAGKALLAALPTEQVESMFDERSLTARTDKTITTEKDLKRELQTIQSRGLAFGDKEWRAGIRSVADTVTDTDGDPVGAVCVTGSVDALSGKRFRQDIPGLVISSANEIETLLRSE